VGCSVFTIGAAGCCDGEQLVLLQGPEGTKQFMTLRERWESLPLPTQFLSLAVPIEILVETGYAIWLMILFQGARQYLTPMVVSPESLPQLQVAHRPVCVCLLGQNACAQGVGSCTLCKF
jgi:hypothetical protein